MGPQSKDRAKTTPAVMCIKILLHIFNLIYFIIGAAVLGIGIWVQVQLKDYMELTMLYYENTAWVMVGVGALILLVALGGFCCTAKDKVALLYMYAVFITVIAILQIAAGIAGGVYSHKIDADIVQGLATTIAEQKYHKAWDEVQKALRCCGVDSPDDWINKTLGNMPNLPQSCMSSVPVTTAATTTVSRSTTASTPISTAGMNATTSTTTTTTLPPSTTTNETSPTTTNSTTEAETNTTTVEPQTSTKAPAPATTTKVLVRRKRQATTETPNKPKYQPFPEGCHKLIKDKVNSYLSVIVGVCVGFVLLQIIGAILACCLAKKTSKNNYEQIY